MIIATFRHLKKGDGLQTVRLPKGKDDLASVLLHFAVWIAAVGNHGSRREHGAGNADL